MNGRKSKELRKKAYNIAKTIKPKSKIVISERRVYQILKKKYKNGDKI